MLVLGRKNGEAIKIFDRNNEEYGEITVVVWHDEYGQIKVGIQAPSNLTILREELEDKPKRSKQ